MRLTIIELRDMVAQAVRRTVREAKKAKLPAQRSEESVAAQRDRQVKALPGYAHSTPLDMSKPLGKRNKVKRQGASNIGNWTSESRGGRPLGPGPYGPPKGSMGTGPGRPKPSASPAGPAMELDKLKQAFDSRLFSLRRERPEIRDELDQIARAFNDYIQASSGGPGRRSEAAVRKLVGMVVDEEVRVSGRR